jgi:hypothetical protein
MVLIQRRRRIPMKTAIALLAVLVLLLGTAMPSDAWVRAGHFHGGFRCCWGGWWWPGAVVGGLALGAVAAATYPFYAAPPAYGYAPPAAYSAPPVVAQQSSGYSAPAVQREVAYPNGKYVLYGDGGSQPWQWVWVPAGPPAPPPPPPR